LIEEIMLAAAKNMIVRVIGGTSAEAHKGHVSRLLWAKS